MKVGQKVYVKKAGNAARNRDKDELIEEATIEKVGRKYFYLEGRMYNRSKFCIEQKRDISDYSSNYYVYETLKEIEEEMELAEKLGEIKRVFGTYGKNNLSLETIRTIYNLIVDA